MGGRTLLCTDESCFHATSELEGNSAMVREEVTGVPNTTSVRFEADMILDDELEHRDEMWLPISESRRDSSMWPIQEDFEEKMWQNLKCGSQSTEEEKRAVLELLKNHRAVFPAEDSLLGCCKLPSTVHVIETRSHPLIKQPSRHYGPWKENEIVKQVRDMLRVCVIIPSDSEWASNVVLVPKKAVDVGPQALRLTINYRDLNEITKKSIHPVPNIQSSLDCLGESKIYSSIDLFIDCWNLHIRQEDEEKTAF